MSGLHLFGLNCQTRSDHMYCIFLSKLIGCSDTPRSASSLWFSSSSCNVQTMLLNPKSPYLGVGCEYKHILQILKVYLGQFFVFDNPKRDYVCCSVEGKTPANRAPGLQASIRAIHCLSSRHPSVIFHWDTINSIMVRERKYKTPNTCGGFFKDNLCHDEESLACEIFTWLDPTGGNANFLHTPIDAHHVAGRLRHSRLAIWCYGRTHLPSDTASLLSLTKAVSSFMTRETFLAPRLSASSSITKFASCPTTLCCWSLKLCRLVEIRSAAILVGQGLGGGFRAWLCKGSPPC